MAEQNVQIAPNSTGLKIRLEEVVVAGPTTVEQQVVTLADSSGNLLDSKLQGVAQDGTDGTGITPPTGASGIRGWLSGIFNRLAGGLPAALGAGGGLKIDGSGTPLAIRLQDGTTATLMVVRSADPGDAAAFGSSLDVRSILAGYNGATFDRLRSGGDNADAVATASLGEMLTIARPSGFNGSTWDRLRTAAAAVLSATSGLGAHLVAPPGNWSVVSAPAVSTQASAVKAAGGAGVRHICTNISFGLSSAAVLAAGATMIVNLRDGASGAGTILKTWQFALGTTGAEAGAIAPVVVSISGLSEVGTAATAMTLEFTALLTGLLEFVNLGGYDAS